MKLSLNHRYLRIFLSYWLVPLIAFSVAARQYYLAHYLSLSPWSGGGFGMFTTSDNPNNRFCHIHLLVDNQVLCVEFPSDMGLGFKTLDTHPNSDQLNDMTKKIASKTWVRFQKKVDGRWIPSMRALKPGEKPESIYHLVHFSGAKIEVWKGQLDFKSFTLAGQKVMESEWTPPQNS